MGGVCSLSPRCGRGCASGLDTVRSQHNRDTAAGDGAERTVSTAVQSGIRLLVGISRHLGAGHGMVGNRPRPSRHTSCRGGNCSFGRRRRYRLLRLCANSAQPRQAHRCPGAVNRTAGHLPRRHSHSRNKNSRNQLRSGAAVCLFSADPNKPLSAEPDMCSSPSPAAKAVLARISASSASNP